MADQNYAIKGAIKGLMAGLRGYTAGKLALKQATTARAQQEAKTALENRKQALAEAKALLEHQLALRGETREDEQFKLDKEAQAAEEKRKQEEQERLQEYEEDYTETEKDLMDLEDQYDMETDPEKRKAIRDRMSRKRKQLLRISSRIGRRMPGLEAEQKAETDEAAAAAEHQRDIEAETAKEKQEKAAAEAAKKEALAALEANKDAFTEDEYKKIKAQIELGETVDITEFIKKRSTTDFATTQEILDIYTDIPNKTVLNNIANIITSKDEAQRFLRSAHRWLEGRSFDKLDDTSKERVAKLFINETIQNVAGGDIVKRHLRAYKLLKVQLPQILLDVAQAKANGKDLGRLAQAEEGIMRWVGGTSDPEITALRTKITDVLNGYIALRSGAQVTEQERQMYQSIFANIGAGYEANKATIEGLMTNVLRDLGANYKEVMGEEWGEYATTIEFEQDAKPPAEWVSEVLEEYELTGKSDVIVPEDLRSTMTPDAVLDIYAQDAETIMKEKGLSVDGYIKSVEAELRKSYPDLSDAEVKELMDTFKEKIQGGETEEETEEETETDNTELVEKWNGKSEEEKISMVRISVESEGADATKTQLMEVFGLSEEDAQALIDKATAEETTEEEE